MHSRWKLLRPDRQYFSFLGWSCRQLALGFGRRRLYVGMHVRCTHNPSTIVRAGLQGSFLFRFSFCFNFSSSITRSWIR
jgi:hypothetical protein